MKYIILIVLLYISKSCVSTPTPPPSPLVVSVSEIGDTWALFKATGPGTLYNLPVVDIGITYQIDQRSNPKNITNSSSNLNDTPFNEMVNVTGLTPGHMYKFQFAEINSAKQTGPESAPVNVLLLPETPNVAVDHVLLNKIVVSWSFSDAKTEDYFMLGVEKVSAPGCGVMLNISKCFGYRYPVDDLERGQTYQLSMRAHNPSGFSNAVIIKYPIN